MSVGVVLDGPADIIEHPPQGVVVGVPQAHIGVGHVAGLDGLREVADRREVAVDDPLTVTRLDLLDPRVAGDVTVPVRTQRNDAGGVGAGHGVDR